MPAKYYARLTRRTLPLQIDFFFSFAIGLSLYGKAHCTPNMHLHLPSKKSVFKDFGPPHAFWYFAFEWFNRILGSYHTNKKAVECQFMKKLLTNQSMHRNFSAGSHPLEQFFHMKGTTDDFESYGSTLTEFCDTPIDVIKILTLPLSDIHRIDGFANNTLISLFHHFLRRYLNKVKWTI